MNKDLGPFAGPLRPVLYAQTRMLDTIIHKMTGVDKPKPAEWDIDVIRVTSLMLQAMGVSMHSILSITQERSMAIRDAFGMARSIAELAVNACYILTSGVEAARRADRHAMQKTYRDFNRRGEIGGTLFEVKRVAVPEIDEVPGLRAALNEFTDRKGREVRDWTPLDMSARISEVRTFHEGAAIALSGATMSIYRHSSEMLHGTYYSTIHFWKGASMFGGKNVPFSDRWDEHFTSVFSSCYLSAQGVVEVFSRKYDLPELIIVQREMNKKFLALVESFAPDSTGDVNVQKI